MKKISFKKLRERHAALVEHVNAFGALLDDSLAGEDLDPETSDTPAAQDSAHRGRRGQLSAEVAENIRRIDIGG
jgi:hypothetical protein